jgi:hypothetical protein
MGDVLEHMTKEDAQKLLDYIYPRCKEVMIAIPYEMEQGEGYGNIYQIHHQPDLTPENFLERYPMMALKYQHRQGNIPIYGYYIKKENLDQRNICIYSICKDEMEHVKDFIDHLDDASSIVILDTGSTDGTWEYLQERAKTNPRLIVDQQIITPFRFDQARNIAYSMVPDDTEFCVALDLDERLGDNWASRIRDQWNDDYLFARNI